MFFCFYHTIKINEYSLCLVPVALIPRAVIAIRYVDDMREEETVYEVKERQNRLSNNASNQITQSIYNFKVRETYIEEKTCQVNPNL